MSKKVLDVVSLSLDATLLDSSTSMSFRRQLLYAQKLGSLTVVVMTTAKRLTSLHKNSVTVFSTNSLTKWLYLFDIFKFVKFFKNADVIIAQDPFITGLAAILMRSILGKAVVIQLHSNDLFTPEWRWHSLQNRILYSVACFVLSKADGIRYLTKRQYKRLKKYPIKADCVLFQAGVPISVATFDSPKREQRKKISKLLVVARLSWEKHISLVLHACKKLDTQLPDYILTIVGEGPRSKKLKKVASELGIRERVHFLGSLDSEHVAEHMSQADALIIPSFYEGMPLVVAEAFASRLLVFVNSALCDTQLLEPGETVIDFRASPTFLADVIKKTSADINLRRVVTENAKNRVARFYKSDELAAAFVLGLESTFESFSKKH